MRISFFFFFLFLFFVLLSANTTLSIRNFPNREMRRAISETVNRKERERERIKKVMKLHCTVVVVICNSRAAVPEYLKRVKFIFIGLFLRPLRAHHQRRAASHTYTRSRWKYSSDRALLATARFPSGTVAAAWLMKRAHENTFGSFFFFGNYQQKI